MLQNVINMQINTMAVGETWATCYKFHFFFTYSDGYDGNGFKFLVRYSLEFDQIMCTICGN